MKSLKHYSLVLLLPLLLSNGCCFAMEDKNGADNFPYIPVIGGFFGGVVFTFCAAYFFSKEPEQKREPKTVEEFCDMTLDKMQDFMKQNYAVYQKAYRKIEDEKNKSFEEFCSGRSDDFNLVEFDRLEKELKEKHFPEYVKASDTIGDLVKRGAQFPPDPVQQEQK